MHTLAFDSWMSWDELRDITWNENILEKRKVYNNVYLKEEKTFCKLCFLFLIFNC